MLKFFFKYLVCVPPIYLLGVFVSVSVSASSGGYRPSDVGVSTYFTNHEYAVYFEGVEQFKKKFCDEYNNCGFSLEPMLASATIHVDWRATESEINKQLLALEQEEMPDAFHDVMKLKSAVKQGCKQCVLNTVLDIEIRIQDLSVYQLQSSDIGLLYYALNTPYIKSTLTQRQVVRYMGVMERWATERARILMLVSDFSTHHDELRLVQQKLNKADELAMLIDMSDKLDSANSLMRNIDENQPLFSRLDSSVCLSNLDNAKVNHICNSLSFVESMNDNIERYKRQITASTSTITQELRVHGTFVGELSAFVDFSSANNDGILELKRLTNLLVNINYHGKTAYDITEKIFSISNTLTLPISLLEKVINTNVDSDYNIDLIKSFIAYFGYDINLVSTLNRLGVVDALILKSTVLFVNGYNNAAYETLKSNDLLDNADSRFLVSYILAVNGKAQQSADLLVALMNDEDKQGTPVFSYSSHQLISDYIRRGVFVPEMFSSAGSDTYKSILNDAITIYDNKGLYASELNTLKYLLLVEHEPTIIHELLKRGVLISYREKLTGEYTVFVNKMADAISDKSTAQEKLFVAEQLINIAHWKLANKKLAEAALYAGDADAMMSNYQSNELLYQVHVELGNELKAIQYAYLAAVLTETQSSKKTMLTNSIFHIKAYIEKPSVDVNALSADKRVLFSSVINEYLSSFSEQKNIKGIYHAYLAINPDTGLWNKDKKGLTFLTINEHNLDVLYAQKLLDSKDYQGAVDLFETSDNTNIDFTDSVVTADILQEKIAESRLRLYQSEANFEQLRKLAVSGTTIAVSDPAIIELIKLESDYNSVLLIETLLDYKQQRTDSKILDYIDKHIMRIYEAHNRYRLLADYAYSLVSSSSHVDDKVYLLDVAASANKSDDDITTAIKVYQEILALHPNAAMNARVDAAKYVLDHTIHSAVQIMEVKPDLITVSKGIAGRVEYNKLLVDIDNKVIDYDSVKVHDLALLRRVIKFNRELNGEIKSISNLQLSELDSRVLDLTIKSTALLLKQVTAVSEYYQDENTIHLSLVQQMDRLTKSKKESVSKMKQLVSRGEFDNIINEYVSDEL